MKKVSILRMTVLLFVATLMCSRVFAQADVHSPYSIYGIGQMADKAVNAKLKGMGGLTNAMSGSGLINLGNPASYARIDSLAFLFDAGMYFKTSTFSTSNQSEKSANASFDHIAVAFGLTPWWKMALGVQPYSTLGYKMVVNTTDEQVGNYATAFEGSGGLNQARIGNAFKIGKHFSIGANVNYVFGDSESLTTLYFPDSSYILGTRRGIDLMVSSFKFDYGLLYTGRIGSEYTLSVGATYDQRVTLSGKQTTFVRTIANDMETPLEYLIDTISYNVDESTSMTVPQSFGVGVALQRDNRWTIGADFNWTQWSKFAYKGGITDSLCDAWRVSVGAEYMPTYSSISNYFRKASYRIGGFYEHTYINIREVPIAKMGLTMGVSLPLPRSLSKVNVALEVGRCGTKRESLIQEGYMKVNVGISVFERWFMKRKYK